MNEEKEINKEGGNMEYTGKEEMIELFSRFGFLIKDIDIDEKENLANIYVAASDTELYRTATIDNIVKKVKEMKEELTKEGMIEDIMFGDLYKGSWRILVYFRRQE